MGSHLGFPFSLNFIEVFRLDMVILSNVIERFLEDYDFNQHFHGVSKILNEIPRTDILFNLYKQGKE